MASNGENAMFMQTMEDSSLRQSWRLTNVLIRVRIGALTQRDVKNEGTSGDMYENKGTWKMKNGTSGDVDENTQVNR
jgi:hypothetical protein